MFGRAHVLVNFEVDTTMCYTIHMHAHINLYSCRVVVWRRNVKSQTTAMYTYTYKHTNTEQATTLLVVNSAQDMCESSRDATTTVMLRFRLFFRSLSIISFYMPLTQYLKMPFHKSHLKRKKINAKCVAMLCLHFIFSCLLAC